MAIIYKIVRTLISYSQCSQLERRLFLLVYVKKKKAQNNKPVESSKSLGRSKNREKNQTPHASTTATSQATYDPTSFEYANAASGFGIATHFIPNASASTPEHISSNDPCGASVAFHQANRASNAPPIAAASFVALIYTFMSNRSAAS